MSVFEDFLDLNLELTLYLAQIIFAMLQQKTIGAVAQLGERNVRNVEARGSIPLSSTNHDYGH